MSETNWHKPVGSELSPGAQAAYDYQWLQTRDALLGFEYFEPGQFKAQPHEVIVVKHCDFHTKQWQPIEFHSWPYGAGAEPTCQDYFEANALITKYDGAYFVRQDGGVIVASINLVTGLFVKSDPRLQQLKQPIINLSLVVN